MVYSSEFGHHIERCYHDQDGVFVVPKDGHVVVQSSGYVRDENIGLHATTNLPCIGLSAIRSTAAKGTKSLDPPCQAGIRKVIVCYSSFPWFVRTGGIEISYGSTAANATVVRFSSGCPSATRKKFGRSVALWSVSTSRWQLERYTSTATVTLTTTT